MDKRLVSLEVENFRSLRKIVLPLGDLTVLVGPNGAGKTNVFKVFEFLADIIRADLEPALDQRGGFDEVVFQGGARTPSSIKIKITATWTTYSTPSAPDEYQLRITRRLPSTLMRQETFQFKRTKGRGRRITINGQRATVVGTGSGGPDEDERSIGIKSLSSGLSTLPRLQGEAGGEEVTAVADRLASFRVFDVAVDQARQAARVPGCQGATVSGAT
jgi:predicted ATPase